MQAAGLSDHLDFYAAYAAGTASPGAALIAASQLTLRPESRAVVAAMEEVGGRLLAGDDAPCEAGATVGRGPDALEMSDGALDAVLGALDHAEEEAIAAPKPGGPLPRPILEAAGVGFSEIQWRWRLGGVHEFVLDGFDDERVSVLKAKPGVRIPHHTHRGVEATLVLTGALSDHGVEMTRGDLSLCGPEDDHHPEIVGDEICYCLVVREGALRFKTQIGRALRFFC